MRWSPSELREAFDRVAQHWRSRHAQPLAARLVRAWRTRRLLAALRLGPASAVLDVGCGTGEQLIALLAHIGRGVGIDISPEMIRRARAAERPASPGELAFHVLAIEQATPAHPGRFDAVLFVGSLEHMADPELALKRAARLLQPGGRLAVVMPHPFHPRSAVHRLQARCGSMPSFRHLRPRHLAAMALRAGLVPVQVHGLAKAENLLSLVLLGSYLALFEHRNRSIRGAPTKAP